MEFVIFKQLTLLIKVLKDGLDFLQILGRELDRRRGPATHFGLRHLGDWFLLKVWLNSEISQHSVVFHTFKLLAAQRRNLVNLTHTTSNFENLGSSTA